MEGDRRVHFCLVTKRGTVEGRGTLIGQGPAGGAVIPDGTHEVLSLKYGEFQILPEQSQDANPDSK